MLISSSALETLQLIEFNYKIKSNQLLLSSKSSRNHLKCTENEAVKETFDDGKELKWFGRL